MKTLDQLGIGTTAVITGFKDEEISLKLMQMGCIPGESVVIQQIAPLGCPIAIEISGSVLSMRKSEAATVILEENTEISN